MPPTSRWESNVNPVSNLLFLWTKFATPSTGFERTDVLLSVTFSDFSQSYSESFLPFQTAQCLASHFLLIPSRKKELSPPTFTSAFLSVPEAGLNFHHGTGQESATTHCPLCTEGGGTPHPAPLCSGSTQAGSPEGGHQALPELPHSPVLPKWLNPADPPVQAGAQKQPVCSRSPLLP